MSYNECGETLSPYENDEDYDGFLESLMLETIYLELQEIKTNAEAVLFSVSQLEELLKEAGAVIAVSADQLVQETSESVKL